MLTAGVCTTYDNTTSTAHVPSLKIDEGYYWIDLKFTGEVFRLVNFGETEQTNICAEYDGDTMSVYIPCVDLDIATTFWVDFVLDVNENLDLVIKDFGENSGDLVINEIVAKDASGGNDWIELYVKGSQSIDLVDYYLADADHEKSSLPLVTLNPGDFYLIQATDEALTDASAYVPFKLGSTDSLILYEGKNIIDVINWEEGDALKGYSYGRLPDGSGLLQTLSPTPAAENATDSSTITEIVLNGDSVNISGSGASAEESILTITSGGSYSLRGSLADGQILVDTEDDKAVTLIFNGVDIRSSTTAPVCVMNAEETFIVLTDSTENYISDGTAYIFPDSETDEPNAALFSKDDLTISGTGSLTVDANYNDGIASKDDLVIAGGIITVNSVDDGIRGKDSLEITDGTITLNVQGDGLKSDNEDVEKGNILVEDGQIQISSGGDAIQAEREVLINGGKIYLASGGGSTNIIGSDESAKGIKGGVSVTINDGIFTIDSADDAIHSNESIAITSGDFLISSGDDAVHADTSIEINGGYFDVLDCFEGIESSVITINDGTIRIVSSDDAINIAGGKDGSGMNRMPGAGETFRPDSFSSSLDYWLYINGGYIVVDAAGDGIDVNGSARMNDGIVIVNGPLTAADGALDYEGSFQINGGFMVAVGSAGMAMAPDSSSSQNSLLLNFTSAQQAGSLIHIQKSDSSGILTFAPLKAYQSVVFSSEEVLDGSNYDIYTGGSSTGTVEDGLYQDGIYTPGSLYTSFTVSGSVTYSGNNGHGPF